MDTRAWCYLRFKHSSKVLDIDGASVDDSTPVIQWSSGGSAHQLFRWERCSDGWGVLRVKHSGKVLDVDGASDAPGTRVIQFTQNGHDNQLFKWEARDQGWGVLRVSTRTKLSMSTVLPLTVVQQSFSFQSMVGQINSFVSSSPWSSGISFVSSARIWLSTLRMRL